MLVGYMRASKSDSSQTTDLRRDALLVDGVSIWLELRSKIRFASSLPTAG